ncbi:MAG: polysulfide reductase NrfD [Deltaproteobacteria bacterium]|nr:polysulfide reductase NrfD [Deltaproteobacteria bacterium]
MKTNNTGNDIRMWTPATAAMVLVMLAGLGVMVYRLISGLGASTHLNDNFPWGIWLAVDVLGGVAMAAGGFIIASMVYLFNMKKYKPITRPAILTAFIGYLLAIVAIIMDIGQPHRIWHPAVMWQIRSVMWVVAIHVMLYTTTLALEFSPMLFERLGWHGAVKTVQKIMVPVVLFGALLSVLHQSSLGAVFLIVPGKLSPFWYNSKLPFLFLVSAVMMGLSMVSLETILSARIFRHPVDMGIFTGLARALAGVALFYFVLKMYFLVTGPGVAAVFSGSMEANMYLIEMALSVILPLALLLGTKMKESLSGLLFIDVLVIAGVLINRLNVGIFGLYRHNATNGQTYFPSWMEFAVTFALIALAFFIFKMAARHLPLLSSETASEH